MARARDIGLAIDPGIRDMWGAGYQPFMEAALGEQGVIGGLIWGGFGEVFAIPLDLTLGEGPWAHLPAADYVRTRDHYPAEPGVFRRGDGDWGIFDAWNRARPEVWHVHGMYSPIRITADGAGAEDGRLTVALENRFAHRSLEGLEIRVSGGRIEDGAEAELTARPGRDRSRSSCAVNRARTPSGSRSGTPRAGSIDGGEWPWPGAAPAPRDAVLERAAPVRFDLSAPGTLGLTAAGRGWLQDWPQLHVLDVDMPHVPVPLPRTDGGHLVSLGPDALRVPLAGWDWEGSVTARIEGGTVVFEYACTYLGDRAFNAKEVGLTLRPSRDLVDLWWHRIGEWALYPPAHVGRTVGYARGAAGTEHARSTRRRPGSRTRPRPAATTTGARSGASSSPAPPTAGRR